MMLDAHYQDTSMSALRHFSQSKYFKLIIITLFLIFSFLFWLGIEIYGNFYVSTDDAYINANVVQIAPRVSGKINTMSIVNNQYVQQGQLLFAIDDTPFNVALEKADAQLAMNQATLTNAESTATRTMELVKKKFLSQQQGDNVTATLQNAEAGFKLAKATLDQAQLDLSWTKIAAPTNGWVTNVSLRVGDMAIADQPVFALISDNEFWVDANFKETEMEHIKPGQEASIHVDMYPNQVFKGVVESISGGTGSVFSLLPPQNATGNWVKVTQRVPVRVRIVNPDPRYPLRIGTSVNVTIHLRQQITSLPDNA